MKYRDKCGKGPRIYKFERPIMAEPSVAVILRFATVRGGLGWGSKGGKVERDRCTHTKGENNKVGKKWQYGVLQPDIGAMCYCTFSHDKGIPKKATSNALDCPASELGLSRMALPGARGRRKRRVENQVYSVHPPCVRSTTVQQQLYNCWAVCCAYLGMYSVLAGTLPLDSIMIPP